MSDRAASVDNSPTLLEKSSDQDRGSSILRLCLTSVPFRFYVIFSALILYSVLATFTIVKLKKVNRKLRKKQKVKFSKKKSQNVCIDMHPVSHFVTDVDELPPPPVPVRTTSLLNIDELPLPPPPTPKELKKMSE
jgi:hypothetical protein